MRRIIRPIVALSFFAMMLFPGQAQALLNSQCGAYHSGTASCMFTAVGPNISLSGSTTSNGLVVRVTDATGTVRILECQGQFSCNASFGIPSTGTDSVGPPPGVGPMLCTVITSGSGYFSCGSNI
jgi:hypothetical protein